MAPRFGTIRAYGSEAMANFSWREYAPFAWLLAAEFLFLFLASNLGSTWGMATAGRVALLVDGDGATHHPGLFVHLPRVFAYTETAIYTLVGTVVLPMALAGLVAHYEPTLQSPTTRSARVRGAVLPTFLGLLLCVAVSVLWQWLVGIAIIPVFRLFLGGGFNSIAATWAVSSLLGYAIVAAVYHVPIVALRTGQAPMAALTGGLREGIHLLWGTFLYLLLFSIPALLVQVVLQLFPTLVVVRLRPELILVLLFVYATLTSFATYLSYSAAVRLHMAEVAETEEAA